MRSSITPPVLVEHAAVERLAAAPAACRRRWRAGARRKARTRAPVEVDHAHVRDVEHAGGAAHGVVLADLRAVVDRHVPAAEVDHAGAEFLVQLEERRLSSHRLLRNAKERQGAVAPGARFPAALLSCDLRDQAPARRSPSVGEADCSTALQKPRGRLGVPPSAVHVPERFRAELRLRRSGVSRTLSEQTDSGEAHHSTTLRAAQARRR